MKSLLILLNSIETDFYYSIYWLNNIFKSKKEYNDEYKINYTDAISSLFSFSDFPCYMRIVDDLKKNCSIINIILLWTIFFSPKIFFAPNLSHPE